MLGACRFLALLSVISSACSGCSKQPPPSDPIRLVRMNALLPLHPSWPQLEALQSKSDLHTALVWNSLSFHPFDVPGLMDVPSGLPASRVADHERTVREDSALYLAKLESEFMARSVELVEAKRKSEEQATRTEYNTAVQQKEVELRQLAAVQAKALQTRLNTLNYRAESLASQARVYSSPGINARRLLEDVRLQQVELDRRIQLLNTEIEGVSKADFVGLAKESLKSVHTRLVAEADARVAKFKEAQLGEDRKELEAARARVDAQPTPISALQEHVVDEHLTGAAPLSLNVNAPVRSDGGSSSNETALAATLQNLDDSKFSQRYRAMLEADVARTVDRVARENHWHIVYSGNAIDATDKVASQLKLMWSPSTK